MTTGIIHDQNLEKHIEKQMGCMAGFFQIFDRHQILTGKRLYSSTKRLTPSPSPSPVIDSPPEPEEPKQTKATVASPVRAPRSPAPGNSTPAVAHLKMLPVFEFKEGIRSPWKFGKEAPRLSLDSRAMVDAKGKLYPKEIPRNATVSTPSINSEMDGGEEKRRSTSVIARLMGLEPIPDTAPEPVKNAELRRSASESRVSKDLSRFLDADSFQLKQSVQPKLPKTAKREYAKKEKIASSVLGNRVDHLSRPWNSPQQRKSYFDSEDFFPEPKQDVTIYNEIERKLRMRGIDEPCKDLETLKQILEAIQLKGLLHNRRPSDGRNYVYVEESPTVLTKHARSRAPPSSHSLNNRSVVRRNIINGRESFPAASPRRELPRNTSSAKSSPNSSPVRRRPLSLETQRRGNEFPDQRRASPVHSPRLSPRRTGSEQTLANRSPRNRRLAVDAKQKVALVVEDESSSISESTISTSSQTESERSKIEEHKGGRSLLERCDKLLHSIAEMTTAELQPSPVSVLDSSFYKDDSSSPSPIMKRSINFKDSHGEYEEDIWSPAFSPIQSRCDDTIQDCDYTYMADVLSACSYLPEDADMFLLLEKQQYLKGNDTSKVPRLQRKLIFDTINEILDRNRQLPPWKLTTRPSPSEDKPSLSHIWSEFQRIRERDSAEDLFDMICGVLRKDLAGDAMNGWGDCHVEMSEAVLDMERLIFKDLVGETIRDLATLGGNNMVFALRRKLVF